jgi:ATP-dependent DNA helicase RecG
VDVGGPLARMIERTWQVVWESMDKKAVVRGLQREEETEYPMIAVREALVNAVAHRDYRIMGRRIEVMMFKDRLEVSSPGGLPGYITLKNIVDEHFSRNPRLVNGLLQWGYIEELGLGVDKMIEAMVALGHPSPDFRATAHSFTVILRKGHEVGAHHPMPQWESNMNERQMKALQWVQERGRITNRDYRQLCPNVSAETLRLDLVDLVDKGILLKIGIKKGTYYVLKRKPQ